MIGNFIGAPIGGAVNTSGTLYSQAISASGSGSLGLTRSVGKRSTVAATGTASLARAIAHALGITGLTTATAQKAISHQGPSISGAGTATLSFTKRIQQAISIATAGVLSVSFHAGRVVMLHMTATGTASLGPKQISKALTWAATGTSSVVKSVLKLVSTTLAGAITFAFAFFRFVTKPNAIGKQITASRTDHTEITSDGSGSANITGPMVKNTDITASNSLPRKITV